MMNIDELRKQAGLTEAMAQGEAAIEQFVESLTKIFGVPNKGIKYDALKDYMIYRARGNWIRDDVKQLKAAVNTLSSSLKA